MKALLGCTALAFMLVTGSLAAQEAQERAEVVVTPPPGTASVQSDKAGPSQTAVATSGGAGALAAATAVAAEIARPPAPPAVTLVLKTDLRAQRLTVVERGRVKHVWPISSGQSGYATSTGTFRPQWMTKMWYSRQWDMAPMSHAIFFNGGTAFHGTAAVSALGRPASHGCVRLAPGNAAQLYSLVQRHGMVQTKVIVQGSTRALTVGRQAPAAAGNRLASLQSGYAGAYRAGRNSDRYGAPYTSYRDGMGRF